MEQDFQNPKRNLPRDVFLHLLSIVTLYWTAVSFVTLCWQYVNNFFPDPLRCPGCYQYYSSGPMRFAIASLIIVFPVFLLVSKYLIKVYTREAQVRESKIRKWLIYFTLFIAALVIIGDLVSVINTYLEGDITVKFILKALSVLLVAGLIFGYYLDDVRKEIPTKSAKYFALFSGTVILIGVVGAFFIVGSPATARLLQFDQQKVNDLQGIQSQVVYYWQRKQVLPESLSDLNDPISSFMVPNDPQTGSPYEYNIIERDNLSFELCANFNKQFYENISPRGATVPLSKPINDSNNWQHAVGRVCFPRLIDPQLYLPITK